MAITATINGKVVELPREVTVAEFLKTRGLSGRRLAVAHNSEVVASADYDTATIRNGDVLEVVRPVGGG